MAARKHAILTPLLHLLSPILFRLCLVKLAIVALSLDVLAAWKPVVGRVLLFLGLFLTLLFAFLFSFLVVLVAVLLVGLRLLLLVPPLVLLAVVVWHLLLDRFVVLCQGLLVFLLTVGLRIGVLNDLVVAPKVSEDFALNTFALPLFVLATLFFYWVLILIIFLIVVLSILLFLHL